MEKNKWTTREGIEMDIKDMETSHILNTIKLLKKAENEAESEEDEVFTADHWSLAVATYKEFGKKAYRDKIKEFKKELKGRTLQESKQENNENR